MGMLGSTLHLRLLALIFIIPATGMAQPAGPRDCDPAVIDSVITNNPLCPGDSVELAVQVSGDVLGYSWQGPGTGTYFTSVPAMVFSPQVLGEYTIVVFGICGNDTATVVMNAEGAGAGQDDIIQVCDDGAPRVLGQSLGPHAEGGWWTFNGQPHNGIFDPAIDLPGDYIYTSPYPATCPGSTQSATVTVTEVNTGRDTTWSICQSDPAFNMMLALAATADTGGEWARLEFLSWIPHGDLYNPAVDSSGIFRYSIGNCYATVQMVEQPASIWFADADNDSLGDPLDWTWSCTQPPGYVADSTDDCGMVAGVIGSPCDDGNPGTINDQVTDSCTCAGTFTTAIAGPESLPPFSLWPNPGDGRELWLQAPISGEAELSVYDAMGRALLDRSIRPVGAAIGIAFPQPLAAGLYWLRLDQQGRSRTQMFVVR
jgi:hypothetical protein